MNSILEKANNMKTSIIRFGAQARAVVREVCTLEFLGLATMLLPALMASVGFFFGKTVTPAYFWCAVAILTCAAFLVGWRRGLAYLALLAVCTVLTMYTFSYTGTDQLDYHFPMQYLLHHGWNPVFDSTVEKFSPMVGETALSFYHTLFLPKFSALCGAVVASAFNLFVGSAFLGYVLLVCLFSACMKFGRRYWQANPLLCVLFAGGITFTTQTISFIFGGVDYTTYAAFCISSLMLVLYVRDKNLSDLVLFVLASCICMSAKSTGILCCGVLMVMMFPLLYKRAGYWRALLVVGFCVALVGSSPLLTNWIQYGSPFYPSMTFDPNVEVVDITNDFTGNADAMSMGYFSRICYAWVSPKLTVFVIRLLEGNQNFCPVFNVCHGVAGKGLAFNCMLLASAVMLAFARKNLITWLCVVIFVSSNFVPLKYIGFSRYFPQIQAIFPLAILNFICTTEDWAIWQRVRSARKLVVLALSAALCGLFVMFFFRTLAFQGHVMVMERFRQNLIATFPKEKPVRVCRTECRFSNVQRFKQAGIRLIETPDGAVDTVIDYQTGLPCIDTHPEVLEDLYARFPNIPSVKDMIFRYRWLDVFDNLPHVLWDDNAKEISR